MGDRQESGTRSAFNDQVKAIVSRISRIEAADLQDHLLVREELGIDSLMAMEILYSCEKHLAIKVDETLITSVQTVGDFTSLLYRLVEEKEEGGNA